MLCDICHREGARLHSITVGDETLRLAPRLCEEHSATFLFRTGQLLGEMMRAHEDWEEPR